MPPVYRRLLGLLVATCVLAGAGYATFRIEAHGEALARARAAQLSSSSLFAARESLHVLLRGMEGRVASGASLAQLRALVAQRADAVTLQGAFAGESWWRLFREEFSQHVLVTGADRFQFAPAGTPLSADFSPLLASDSGRSVSSGLVLAGGAPHLAASAVMDVPEAGMSPRLVLARPLSVADLEELGRAARSALLLTDSRGTLLARVGSVPVASEALPDVLAQGNPEPFTEPRGDWAAARAEVAPGVMLWAAVDSRLEAQAARESHRAVLLPVWIAAMLVAGSALLLGMRAPREDVTQELLARTNARLAAAEAQIKRLTTSMPAIRREAAPAAPTPLVPRPTRGMPSLESPVQFGRYELLRPIGQGGMARVYLALTRGTGGFERLFVIKRLHEPLIHQPQMVSLFMDEARLGASLIHSNIISVYDFGEVDGEHYMASEYILGRDLDVVVRRALAVDRRALEPDTVFHLAQQALEGLGYAHTRADVRGRPLGIVHRDVSPMNILASARGEVKLFDFGIAKSAGRSTHTQAGLVKGNVNFMAPEQARGHAVDSRADLFSLGLTLYWCLTGELLYEAPTDYDLLVKAAAGPGEAEWERIARLPAPAAALLHRALQPSPADRFQTAEEFSRALPSQGNAGASTLARTMLRLFGNELRSEAAYRSRLASRQPVPGGQAGAL